VKAVIKVFLHDSCTILETDPMNSFQRNVRGKVNYSKILIRKEGKWKHYNQNPTTPTIKGLLKLHKPKNPI
jgi:2,3-bisphosphoglycerate-independent phosphoglycerate mutase